MLLRSSSTPVLGSLLPSISESPNNISNHYETKLTTIHKKFSFHQTGSLNLSAVSCNSSPISPSIDCDRNLNYGFRRAQSEGNLEGLVYPSYSNNEDRFSDSHMPKMFTRRPKSLLLQTIPSFSFYNSRDRVEEEEEEEESDIEDAEEREAFGDNEELLEREVRGGDAVRAMESTSLGLENMVKNMKFTEELIVKNNIWNVGLELENQLVTQKMYLAKGLGVSDGGGGSGHGGGGGDFNPFGSGGDEGDKHGVEEYYKRMVEENPGNPLFLRNYAEFLYESKGDLKGAEEYYSRAILADPNDGDVLSQYAKLVWELHHDQDRAASYFERAVQASPQDSHVQAAYGNFLWGIEEEENEADVAEEFGVLTANLHGAVASATA